MALAIAAEKIERRTAMTMPTSSERRKRSSYISAPSDGRKGTWASKVMPRDEIDAIENAKLAGAPKGRMTEARCRLRSP